MRSVLNIINLYLIYIVITIYVIIAGLTILFFDGTCDAGDSIHHYQFARHAPLHPALFFDHWAKPLFVLLACPFAQFGFVGIKVFNAMVVATTLFFTFKSAEKLGVQNPILCSIILIFSPLYYSYTFSGLTEPLFALFLIFGVYMVLINKGLLASVIISFLPFIRSEGLFFIVVFGLYFLLKKRWKYLPFLLLGHIVYSVAGYFVYYDFLWVFNKIPYARLSSTYGHGQWFHFIDQFIYVTGVPIYILFWLGVLSFIWKRYTTQVKYEMYILVLGGFFAFFIAHSLFWYWGIFNSMGLKRVLISVMPLAVIIALQGFNILTEEVFKHKKYIKQGLQTAILLYIFIFPFTSNHAAIKANRDLKLSVDQQTAQKTAQFILNNMATLPRVVCGSPYLSYVLNIDPFDPGKRINFSPDLMSVTQPGDLIIWENWFSVLEYGIDQNYFDQHPEFKLLHQESAHDDHREIVYFVFKRM